MSRKSRHFKWKILFLLVAVGFVVQHFMKESEPESVMKKPAVREPDITIIDLRQELEKDITQKDFLLNDPFRRKYQ